MAGITVIMPRLIALCGPQGAGKSQAALSLVRNHGYTCISFADPLYRMLAALLSVSVEELRGMDKNRPMIELEGNSIRHALQTLGTEWGRSYIGGEIWVRTALREIQRRRSQGKLVVIDDLRFRNEYTHLRRVGCCMIKIDRPSAPDQVNPNHGSEVDWPSFVADSIVCNPGDGLGSWLSSAGSVILSAVGAVTEV